SGSRVWCETTPRGRSSSISTRRFRAWGVMSPIIPRRCSSPGSTTICSAGGRRYDVTGRNGGPSGFAPYRAVLDAPYRGCAGRIGDPRDGGDGYSAGVRAAGPGLERRPLSGGSATGRVGGVPVAAGHAASARTGRRGHDRAFGRVARDSRRYGGAG